ncbi:DUF4431 domain-containing protein [Legionella micdadei]|uniref:DUF4431 domain-containing protein n=1 Tax=Legionella micdadei TaxID=451 RepID=A0A098GFC8_LEGMI|nr:DUF4431 domain-containing protein [Legionella micdadei]ARG97723.1 hypothetical protein B6N58_08645 [Legionella micdadei]ARG99964.1 hypothetical protein B6V88_05775 [Legionella micdadei]KTD28425.1 hypothetical protein Lmic_1536 [Legionella micdadei]NSL18803.1 DUF4431 domain-containing protein [Legionella micdadei]CEG60687.1 exported protein of unknown function [Legionella micdadei]
MKFIAGMMAMVISTSLFADSSTQPQTEGCIVEGSQIQLMGKLISETFPKMSDDANPKDEVASETYWILSTEKSYCGESYNSETKALDRIGEPTSRFQLIFKPEQFDDQHDLLGKKVIVEGKMLLPNSGQHHAKMLIDVNTIESATCSSEL